LELVDEVYTREYVEGDREWEQGFTTRRLERAEPATWADALYEFLVTRSAYDDGLGGQFRDLENDETFRVEFDDCWTSSYGEEQAAKNKGGVRQLLGGTYPAKEESARSGEEEDGIWESHATILLTRTGSAVPDGNPLPPVDHAADVTRSWSEGVYDTVRNICEYHLDLDSDEWFYVRGDDVHGIDQSKEGPQRAAHHSSSGKNACYAHAHDGIYINLAATGLRDEFDTDHEVKEVLQSQFYAAIEKHVEHCESAKLEAHAKDESVEVMIDELESPGGYATGYLRLDEDERMMDRPVEFQAFAAVEWATNRQRIARSQLLTEAAKADFCKQDKESKHGERLRYDHTGHGESELVCGDCGSGVGIDADTMTEHRLAEASSQPAVVADGGQVEVGASIGESTHRTRVRRAVAAYIKNHGQPESIPQMLGELGVAPDMEVVEEVLAGVDEVEVEPVMGQSHPPPEYELEELVRPDGSTESPGGGGGAPMMALKLPEQRLLEETRLRYVSEPGCPKIIVEDGDDRLATYNPETAAHWLVSQGYTRPWHAEMALEFTRHGDGLSSVFDEPMTEPPSELGN
jgi:hypothetical protein